MKRYDCDESFGPYRHIEVEDGGYYLASEVDTALQELLEASREAMRCPHASIDCSVCKRHFARLQKALEPWEGR